MDGSVFSKSVAVVFVSALAVGFQVTPVRADVVKCKAAIVKGGAAYIQTSAKALAKCEEAIVKGKAPAGDCRQDVKAAGTITKAVAKLRSTITKACGGKNKICEVGGDDDALNLIGWGDGTCPNFDNGTCTGAITTCSDIATCVACIGDDATDRGIDISYDELIPSDPKTQKVLNKCQVTIGKATTAFFVAKSKALAKCWGSVNANKATSPCPAPGDGKAATAILKAEAKKVAAICKACGGSDKLCNGVGDETRATIGFPSTCPAVTIPGGTACGGPVTTLADVVDCVDCVNEFAVDCADRSTVLDFVPYPAECNPGPTPTATVTETPTATVTATPTESPTATPTASPTPTATDSATPTATSTEPTPTATPTATATDATETPTPTATSTDATPTATPTESPTPTESATPTETATPTTTPTPTETPTPTATETETPTPTATATETPTPTATATETPTPTPTATAGLTDAITHTPTLGDYWGIDGSFAESPPSTIVRQRISNSASLTIAEVDLCLGLELGTESGNVHFEIWSDQVGGCPAGAAFCPLAKLGDNSDNVEVDGLPTLQSSPNGSCGTPNNGTVVTVKWADIKPATTANFWIVGVNNSVGGITTGQVRWGASGPFTPTSFDDTNFDSWKNAGGGAVDNDNDLYFVVRSE